MHTIYAVILRGHSELFVEILFTRNAITAPPLALMEPPGSCIGFCIGGPGFLDYFEDLES